MADWKEPTITINGHTLSTAEAMTVRVALGNFTMDLQADGLGDDEHGKAMVAGYIAAICSINVLMTKGA